MTLMGALAVGPAAASDRVYSLDQCADQYVLALVPRAFIASVSPRADDADSYLSTGARGLPRRRAALEPILASGASTVVRYWGGDAQLTAALQRRGVRVVRIEDAHDFAGVRRNVMTVAAALGRQDAGRILVARMDAKLSAAASRRQGGRALYITSGGFTAGADTLVGAMLAGADLRNASERPGYQAVALERLVLAPPQALVLGYFDAVSLAVQRWAFGRHRQMRRLAAGLPATRLPASILGCPAWFAADGAELLAREAGRE